MLFDIRIISSFSRNILIS